MNTAVRTLTRAGTATAVAALLAAGLTACGDAGGDRDGAAGDRRGANATQVKEAAPADVVKLSYQKTVVARFAAVEMTATGSEGTPDQVVGAKGWYPNSTGIAVKGGAPGTAGFQILMDGVVYTHSDKPVQGKPWMKMNLTKDGAPRPRLNDDPAEYLALLLGQQKVTRVGTEQLDGVAAEHYRAALTHEDLLRADESTKVMEEANRRYLQEAVRDVKTYDIDLWIGKDGHPVRVDTVRTVGDGTARTTAKFSGYGTTAPVVAPPADQVTDFDDALKGIDASLKETERILGEADRKLREAGQGGLKRP
ncbi:hypothetical protein [Streptomyces sp. NPDC001568]|uniref:hypothetical protein n=1 Tax=Streptomyces sp. NPDC001568 TaxID=3364588 RepID=UPI00369C4A64